MMHVDPASLATMSPAKAKSAALDAFAAAAADPAFSDWRGLSEMLAASLKVKPRRKDSDDAPPAWWADYDLPRWGHYVRDVLVVTFACGRVVRCNVHQVPGKPARVAKACRVAVSFYRGGSGRGDVPAMVRVENLTTGETYDAGVCSHLTAALRVDPGPVVHARPAVTPEAVARMEAEVQRRRDARARVAALREAPDAPKGLTPDREFAAAIKAGEAELARMRAALYGPGEDALPENAVDAGESLLSAEVSAEAEPERNEPAAAPRASDPDHVWQDRDGAWWARLDGADVCMSERYPDHVVLIAGSHSAHRRLPEGPEVLWLRYPQTGRVVALSRLLDRVPRGCRVSGPRHVVKHFRNEAARYAGCAEAAERSCLAKAEASTWDVYLDSVDDDGCPVAGAPLRLGLYERRAMLRDALFAFGYEPAPSPSKAEGPVVEAEPVQASPEPCRSPTTVLRPRSALRLAAGLLASSAVSSFMPRMPAPFARLAA